MFRGKFIYYTTRKNENKLIKYSTGKVIKILKMGRKRKERAN